MNARHAAAFALVGWYLLIPPVFSAMGDHLRAFNDLTASLNRWDIQASFESETSCVKEKDRIRNEAPLRLKFAHEHPDQNQNGNIVAVAEAWQRAEWVATDDPRLKEKLNEPPPRRRLAHDGPDSIVEVVHLRRDRSCGRILVGALRGPSLRSLSLTGSKRNGPAE